MYFKSEYDEYYKSLLKNDGSMDIAVLGLQDSITEVTNQFNSVAALLGDLKGEFSKEINYGVDSLLSEFEGLKIIISNDLPTAVFHIGDLGDKLAQLKPKDEKYEELAEEIKAEKGKEPARAVKDNSLYYEKEQEYNAWLNNLNSLNQTLEELGNICEKLQKGCDNDINVIKQFNDKIVELRLKLIAVAASTNGVNLDDINNMSSEEKKAYLDKLILEVTEKYNKFKELYDYFSKDYIFEELEKNPNGLSTDDRLLYFTTMFFELLGIQYDKSKENISLYNILRSDNPVARGNGIITIIEMLSDPENGYNGKTIIDIVADYSKTGSWEESGMAGLYGKVIDNDIVLAESVRNWGQNPEELFWSRVTGGEYEEYNKELLENFGTIVKILDSSKDNFKENYDKALGNAMIIKGVRGLRDCLDYDCTYYSEDYKNYVTNSDLLFINGFDEGKYSLAEAKMISYLLETDSYEAAKKYINLREDTINRRNGQINARNYYESLHNGSNEGIDSVLDHIGVGARGYGDGMNSFADGLIDLIAPDKIMSEHDYETMYFLRELEESTDGYDKSLLTDYRIMNKLGTYTIPTVVNALTGGSGGTALFIASDIGNGIEARQHASYLDSQSYDSLVLEEESYLQSLFQTAVPYAGTDIPNDIFGLVLGTVVKDINPIVGAFADMAFDEVYKPIVTNNNNM